MADPTPRQLQFASWAECMDYLETVVCRSTPPLVLLDIDEFEAELLRRAVPKIGWEEIAPAHAAKLLAALRAGKAFYDAIVELRESGKQIRTLGRDVEGTPS